MPSRVKGCFHCSRRRISCDRTEPHCLKCIHSNLECSGLGIRYRWAKPVKLSTLKGTTRRAQPARPRRGHDEALSPCSTGSPSVDMSEVSSSADSPRDSSSWNLSSTSFTSLKRPETLTPLTVTPRCHPDLWTVNYFAAEVSRWICPTRRGKNEFQALLSPFALERPEVFSAIAATAYHRLAYYGNHEFSVKAERYKSTAIAGLLNNAQQIWGMPDSRQCQLAAMAVIVVMIYDDMVSAQNYFRVLIPIVKTLYKLIDFTMLKSDELGVFLAEQIGLLSVLCLPYFSSADDQREMEGQALRFLNIFASQNDRHPNASFLAFCLRQSVSVWSKNLEQPGANVDSILEDFKSRLDNFCDLQDLDHYLTWVYFNCAAASCSPRLRRFFTDHLRKHVDSIGFKNIPLMLDLLQRLPNDEERWSSRIQGHCEYICA